jgi:hypothetical protein
MEFRLTYEGPLYASANKPRAGHKHDLRREFHKQLKRLWEVVPQLEGTAPEPVHLRLSGDQGNQWVPPARTSAQLAAAHAKFGFEFVPLVTRAQLLSCGLDIFFLRPEPPGKIVQSGDIDGRLKTVLDALQMPQHLQELDGNTPGQDEKPFFVLLENDSLVTKVSVDADTLLQRVGAQFSPNDARIVITVRVRAYQLHPDNMHFG